jgi:hypothetical protein
MLNFEYFNPEAVLKSLSQNTALVAVLTYRFYNSHLINTQRFKPNQREQLQARIDELRAYQAKDAKGDWVDGKYVSIGKVDYMFVSFEKPDMVSNTLPYKSTKSVAKQTSFNVW